jgi:hypothetical protein
MYYRINIVETLLHFFNQIKMFIILMEMVIAWIEMMMVVGHKDMAPNCKRSYHHKDRIHLLNGNHHNCRGNLYRGLPTPFRGSLPL